MEIWHTTSGSCRIYCGSTREPNSRWEQNLELASRWRQTRPTALYIRGHGHIQGNTISSALEHNEFLDASEYQSAWWNQWKHLFSSRSSTSSGCNNFHCHTSLFAINANLFSGCVNSVVEHLVMVLSTASWGIQLARRVNTGWYLFSCGQWVVYEGAASRPMLSEFFL